MEIKIAIGVIIGAAMAMFIVTLLMLRRSYLQWRMHRVKNRIENRYKARIENILSMQPDPGQPMTLEKIADQLGIEIPTEEKVKKSLKKKSKSKDDYDKLTEEDFKKEARKMQKENALKSLKSKRKKRAFCMVLYNCLINDEEKEKPEIEGDPDIIVNYKQYNIKNLHLILELFILPAFLEKEIDHGNLALKVRAMNMMAAFRLEINLWLINAVLESKNPRIRRLATHASIIASGDTDLEYYESAFFGNNSCVKDEIELGYSLYRLRYNKLAVPDLARLALLQKNAGAQAILIRLMRRFKPEYSFESSEQLESLFKQSHDKELTGEIALTWGYLGYTKGINVSIDSIPQLIWFAELRFDTNVVPPADYAHDYEEVWHEQATMNEPYATLSMASPRKRVTGSTKTR